MLSTTVFNLNNQHVNIWNQDFFYKGIKEIMTDISDNMHLFIGKICTLTSITDYCLLINYIKQ